ncbi:MAG: acyl carrier protein [Tissierellales bacterium]|jgi:acyl carrier protein|nr:acyl carrier protein [Tissierellales bacterium]
MLEKVKEILVDELGVEEEEVTLEASIVDDLDADSLDMAQVVMALEDEFDVKVANEDLPNIKTVKDIVDYIEKNQ